MIGWTSRLQLQIKPTGSVLLFWNSNNRFFAWTLRLILSRRLLWPDRATAERWAAFFRDCKEQAMAVSKVELVRQALMALGEASSQEVVTFIQQRHGVQIEARFIPVLRASLRGQQLREQARHMSPAANQTAENPAKDSDKADVAANLAASPIEPVVAAPVMMPAGMPPVVKIGER